MIDNKCYFVRLCFKLKLQYKYLYLYYFYIVSMGESTKSQIVCKIWPGFRAAQALTGCRGSALLGGAGGKAPRKN